MDTPLPTEIIEVLDTYIRGLQDILNENLYGVYMYGASVFPDTPPLQDIDCHVIVRRSLTEVERTQYLTLTETIREDYPGLGEELDAYVILLSDAKGHSIPQHQVYPEIYDHSWALHCAHIRAGYVSVLWGPGPTDVFPTPTWEEVDAALLHELQFVLDHPQYPAYGILNLCRILYSYRTKNPAVSKFFCGRWGMENFPQWNKLIQAAMRFYRKEHDEEDFNLLEKQREGIYSYMHLRIAEIRETFQ